MDYASVSRISNDGTVKSERYWHYEMEPKYGRSHRKLMPEFIELLQQAVQRRIRNGRVSLLLSGGVDSRGILACAEQPSQLPVVVYSGKTRETRHILGDWATADRIAQFLNLDLSVVHYEGGSFLTALENSVFASDGAAGFIFEDVWDLIREQTGTEYVLIGDECMGWAMGPMSATRILSSLGVRKVAELANLRACLPAEKREEFLEMSQADVDAVLSVSSKQNIYDRVDELYFQQRLINWLLPKRRVIVRHGLQVRNPWLDLDVLNFVCTLPVHFRIRKKLFRDALARLHPKLFRIPRARVPETIDYRCHLAQAERASHAISNLILGNDSPVKEFFDLQSVAKLIKTECESANPNRLPYYFRFGRLLPIPLRQVIASLVRSVANPTFSISNTVLLLRIIALSSGLRAHQRVRRAVDESHGKSW